MALSVETGSRIDLHDITDRVSAAVPDDVEAGTCTVFVHHTTTGIAINEAESGLLDDLETVLADLVPTGARYAHDRIDDNADAHLRASLIGTHATVPVRGGSLDLGTWQSILLVELDGPRTRRVSVTVAPGRDGGET